MKKILQTSALVSILALSHCDNTDPPGTQCTEEARSSVTLDIRNSDTNDVLATASVTYTVNGTTKTVPCDDDAMGIQYCGSLSLEYEVAGTFKITISSTGFTDKDLTIKITKGTCHVNGKAVTVKLSPI